MRIREEQYKSSSPAHLAITIRSFYRAGPSAVPVSTNMQLEDLVLALFAVPRWVSTSTSQHGQTPTAQATSSPAASPPQWLLQDDSIPNKHAPDIYHHTHHCFQVPGNSRRAHRERPRHRRGVLDDDLVCLCPAGAEGLQMLTGFLLRSGDDCRGLSQSYAAPQEGCVSIHFGSFTLTCD